MKNALSLAFWVLLSFSAGWFGSQFKPGTWYQELSKPSWTPPSFVFPIAWSLLYTLMGVSAWLVWQKRAQSSWVTTALILFVVQLFLNALWSWIFFGLHQMGWAAMEIGLLWAVVLATLIFFFKISNVAGFLFVPYLVWLTFAFALNTAIWMKN